MGIKGTSSSLCLCTSLPLLCHLVLGLSVTVFTLFFCKCLNLPLFASVAAVERVTDLISGGFTGEIILHSADYKTLLLTFSLPTLKHELSSIFSQSGDVKLCFQVLKATSRRGRFSLPIYKGLPLFSLSVSSSLFLRCVRYQCLSLFVSQRSSVAILSARFRSVCILHVCL